MMYQPAATPQTAWGRCPSRGRQSTEAGRIYSDFSDDPAIRESVDSFVAQLPGRMRTVAGALSAADMDTVAGVAHDLIGAAGGYGFGVIGRAASDVEQAARERSPALRPAAARLMRLCRRAHAEQGGEAR